MPRLVEAIGRTLDERGEVQFRSEKLATLRRELQNCPRPPSAKTAIDSQHDRYSTYLQNRSSPSAPALRRPAQSRIQRQATRHCARSIAPAQPCSSNRWRRWNSTTPGGSCNSKRKKSAASGRTVQTDRRPRAGHPPHRGRAGRTRLFAKAKYADALRATGRSASIPNLNPKSQISVLNSRAHP